MTVSSQTNNVTFVGNGVATSFPLPFRFFSNGDIRAFKIDSTTGASTPLAIGVDYTLIGAGEPEVDGNALSTLTLTAPLPMLLGLYVERVMSPVQETDIVNQGEFFAATHEDVFDRLTMLVQQANANSAGAIRVAIGDPEPKRLSPAAQRANLLLGFDSNGDPITVAPLGGSSAELATNLMNSSDPTKGAGQVGYNPDLPYPEDTVGSALNNSIRTLRASEFLPSVVDAATFQAFLNAEAEKHIVDIIIPVTKAGLEALPLFGLTVPAGGTVEWLDGAWTMLEPGVQVRHIFTGQGAANSNVTYINPHIDGQDSSANGMGGNNAPDSRLEGMWIIGGHIKNIARERVRGSFEGGLGVTFQYGSRDCGVRDTRFTRVHCATDVSGNGTPSPFGDQASFNTSFIGIHCENCEQIGRGFNLLNNSATVNAVYISGRWADITFRNCGRSNEVGTWPGLSFTRINNAGNSSPWTDIYIASTSYNGNWEPSTFSGADAEWTFATGSYAIGNRVKVTNDGTLSSLFHFQGNAGATVDGVNGYNEAAYGQIGALITGTAGGINICNFDVLCNVKDNIHIGSCPNVWPVVTRPTDKMADSRFHLSNIGTAINAVGADSPSASAATPYVNYGLKISQVVRRGSLTNILDSRIGGAAEGWRNFIDISDCASTGSVVGNFEFIFNAQNTVPTVASSSAFNRVLPEGQHIKVHQANTQLRLERTGSNAGIADLYALGAEAHLGTATTFTIDPNGGIIKLKNAAGTVYALAVDASGRLTINGTVVGTQT